jgi:predicted DNA-binding transcriptional regulator YafY
MADTSSRMLRLLSLLQTHRYWPGAELAGRLGVSVRTLRRDVDRLRELGYPVDAGTRSGCGSPTRRAVVSRPTGTSSPTGWYRSGAAGTWSPTT